jgi:hypothetical protein
LYCKAKENIRRKENGSLTEEYRNNILLYIHGIEKRNELYIKVIDDLHEYFQRVTAHSSISFGDFENRILQQFIPAEYYKDFTEKEKDTALWDIIITCTKEFGLNILDNSTGHMRRIVDKHSDITNIEVLKNGAIKILAMKRETFYSKFAIASNTKTSGRNGEEAARKLSAALVDETRRRCTAEDNLKRCGNVIRQLTHRLEQATKKLEAAKLALKDNERRLSLALGTVVPAQSTSAINNLLNTETIASTLSVDKVTQSPTLPGQHSLSQTKATSVDQATQFATNYGAESILSQTKATNVAVSPPSKSKTKKKVTTNLIASAINNPAQITIPTSSPLFGMNNADAAPLVGANYVAAAPLVGANYVAAAPLIVPNSVDAATLVTPITAQSPEIDLLTNASSPQQMPAITTTDIDSWLAD